MIALDTNILVRLLTADNPAQAKRVAKLIEGDDIFIPKTVVLETEWVLRHAYGIAKNTLISAFRKLFGLQNLTLEDPKTVLLALSWHEEGLDFADALHLASSFKATRFATFDKALRKRASKVTSMDVFNP
ncbi:MAG: type II toxin-antitoxin system VapC family toxin [Deltaproteobacteria bacterium]|nr:type II toxin-antitoxin system VapC family toxin [Deltaproteobacteria bacterium]MBW1816012.1 type II toxin-antitoxin system VapC family toxin [Deltaproteobacteria bacterium]